MKKYIIIALAFLATSFTSVAFAQDAQTIKLVQTEGVFDKTELVLEEGTYIFEVENDGVDHPLGFVLAPKGMYEEKDHIKEAYVQKMIANGETSTSKKVTLEKGEYEYFCPLNPTPHYTLTVK